MKSILTVVGARPQFIKAALVSRALLGHGIHEQVLHSGQHFDPNMSDIFFQQLGMLAPAFTVSPISNASHGEMTAHMLVEIEKVLQRVRPSAVLVYGDTNTTLSAGLAAAKLYIPLIHVEAGCRSFTSMPEEINRKLVDHMSSLLLCPSERAKTFLKQEGITKNVQVIGDVMYDAALWAREILQKDNFLESFLSQHQLKRKQFLLATIHRADNTQDKNSLEEFINFLKEAAQLEEMPLVWPVHPRTKKKIQEENISTEGLILLDPLGYLEMQACLCSAKILMTDSGGMQKEAYYQKVPCITLRNTTEWPETIEAGWNILWDFKQDYTNVKRALEQQTKKSISSYGDGGAAQLAAKAILKFLDNKATLSTVAEGESFVAR